MSELIDLRARLSFPGLSRSFAETGRAMSSFVSTTAAVLAPELAWSIVAREVDDLARDDERWSARHVVRLAGVDREGAQRGRAEALLVAGGDAKRMGGNGLCTIETVGPARYLAVDNHCNVTHWDIHAAPLTMAQLTGVRRALEEILGAKSELGGERREAFARAAQVLASSAEPDEAGLWMEDLERAGLASRGLTAAHGVTVYVERASLADVDALDRARIALGEILGEAGHDDWDERARSLLVRLPER